MPRKAKAQASKAPTPSRLRQSSVKNAKITKSGRGGKQGGGAVTKPKHPSLYEAVLQGIDGAMATRSHLLRDDPQSVMNRPTAKTKHFRTIHAVSQSKPIVSKKIGNAEKQAPDTTPAKELDKVELVSRDAINIFHRRLPRNVRDHIFRLVVVDQTHLVYPYMATGKEQPDFAMTCRDIRKEVLQIYYAENVFALEVNGVRMPIRRMIPSMDKWLHTMAEAHWLQQIKRWAFIDEVVLQSRQAASADPKGVPPTPHRDAIETVIISFQWQQKEVDSNEVDLPATPKLEVHGDVRCLLAATGHEARCCIQPCPSWLNEMVINASIDKNDDKVELRPGKMLKMLKDFRDSASEIVGLRCDKS